MKISIAQLDIKRGDPAHNLDLIHRSANHAASQDADLLCLPEMVTTGFDWKKNRQLLAEAHEHHDQVSAIARTHKVAICGSFLECASSGMPCNTLIYFDETGAMLAKYRKLHLFSLFREDRNVEPGEKVVVTDIKHCKAGFGVCYDLRFPELFRKNTDLGAWMQLLPSAFPYPRLEHWRILVRARAIENQCFFIAVNQSGFENHEKAVGTAHYFGHSMIVDPWGEVLIELGEAEDFKTIEIDLALVDQIRAKMTALKDRRPELY